MKLRSSLSTLLLLLVIENQRGSEAQLTVEILRLEDDSDSSSSVIASYSFPTGFSNPLDWFVEPYANIPSDYTGLLYHPVPYNACKPILKHNQSDCAAVCNKTSWSMVSSDHNVSRIALVADYHTCTEKKLENLQMADFDGMITFVGDSRGSQNVNSRVYDSTAKLFVDLATLHQFPVAVVSKTFAQTLIKNATDECNSHRACQQWQPVVLVRLKGDSTRQGWIQIAIGVALVVVVAGIPLLTCVVVCLCCVWCCSGGYKCKPSECCSCFDSCKDCCSWCCERCSKSGVYEVHELQGRFLGHDQEADESVLSATRTVTRQSSRREEYLREREDSLHNLRRSEAEQETATTRSAQFKRTYETSRFKEREFTAEEKENNNYKACTICLCEFEVGERVCILPCDDGHIFHATCIEQWLETNSVCPMCRTFITIPNH